MGEVYRARDSKLGRDVAIKMLPEHLMADPERRARFAREARVLATLNHPHIGAIYELEEIAGESALVLELVEGPTLAERLKQRPDAARRGARRRTSDRRCPRGRSPEAHRSSRLEASKYRPATRDCQLLSTACQGPRLRHRHDWHRAGLDSEHGSTTNLRTEVGHILGTPGYMSPEQARGHSVDKRTDIWAFGCVLFEMLTGRRPFEGPTVTDTVARILEREPEWASLPPGTPASVRTLLQRCLRKDPEKRLHDIADARIEIDDVDLSPSSARVDARRKRLLKWIAVAVLVLSPLAAAIIYVQLHRPQPVSELFEFPIEPPKNATLPSRYCRFRCGSRRTPHRHRRVFRQPSRASGYVRSARPSIASFLERMAPASRSGSPIAKRLVSSPKGSSKPCLFGGESQLSFAMRLLKLRERKPMT